LVSLVSESPAATPEAVVEHYTRRLAFETDCYDVHESLRDGRADFVLLDVRGPALYEKSHVPGAVNIPHAKITARRMSEWPTDTLFVVYCAGPHCNATDKAALRLAKLGRRVKVMIGGITGWIDEGFALTNTVDSANPR
jgi:rhodanese-related sulfurtransferase